MRKKLVLLALAALTAVLFTGCSRYVSSYRALGLARTGTDGAASMTFSSLDGRMVFRLRSGPDKRLKYRASLKEGSAKVYLEQNGTKEELFVIGPGGTTEASAGPLRQGEIWLIVETDSACREGEFRFEIVP